ncbi:hypothetical protein ROZ63_00060 [Pasteurella multocida]|nr:hypothetical protein [Pasteurella multocida]MEB3464736.1 hypothetical protein [Pasteurella multocida]
MNRLGLQLPPGLDSDIHLSAKNIKTKIGLSQSIHPTSTTGGCKYPQGIM